MNSRQKRTLTKLFENPTRSDIDWSAVESLFHALGATTRQGRGSRVRVSLNDRRAVFHTPHPERTCSKGQVESIREFLTDAGIEP